MQLVFHMRLDLSAPGKRQGHYGVLENRFIILHYFALGSLFAIEALGSLVS